MSLIAALIKLLENRTGKVIFVVIFSLVLSFSLFYFSRKYGVIGDFTYKELQVTVKLGNLPKGYVESAPCKVKVKVKGFAMDVVRFSPEDVSCVGEVLGEIPEGGGLVDVKVKCETPRTSVFLEYPDRSKVLVEQFVEKKLPVRVEFQNLPPGLTVSYDKTHVNPDVVELKGGEMVGQLTSVYVVVDMGGYSGSGKESFYLPLKFSDGVREYTADDLKKMGITVSSSRAKVYFEYSEGERLYVAYVNPDVMLKLPQEIYLVEVAIKPPTVLSRNADVRTVRTFPAVLSVSRREETNSPYSYDVNCEGCEVLDVFGKRGVLKVTVSVGIPPGFSAKEIVVQYTFHRAVEVKKYFVKVEVRGENEDKPIVVEPSEVSITTFDCHVVPVPYVEITGEEGEYPLKFENESECRFVCDASKVRVKFGEE